MNGKGGRESGENNKIMKVIKSNGPQPLFFTICTGIINLTKRKEWIRVKNKKKAIYLLKDMTSAKEFQVQDQIDKKS